MRTCNICKLPKSDGEFYTRNRKKPDGQIRIGEVRTCKSCIRKRDIQNKSKYKERTRENERRRRRDRRDLTDKIKDVPCADCGGKFPPYVMDFDHRDKSTKLGTISHLISLRYPWKIILDEIKKCDILCSNCHRIRTYNSKLEPICNEVKIPKTGRNKVRCWSRTRSSIRKHAKDNGLKIESKRQTLLGEVDWGGKLGI